MMHKETTGDEATKEVGTAVCSLRSLPSDIADGFIERRQSFVPTTRIEVDLHQA